MGQLTRGQRCTFSVVYNEDFKQKVIAETIGKDKSVASWKHRCSSNEHGSYCYFHEQMLADSRKERLHKKCTFAVEVKNCINRYR